MKALFLPILPLAMLTCAGLAQETIRTKVQIETRSDGKLYRAVPRGGTGDANKQRFRVAYYRPTQHYYTRDQVISYRYAVQMSSTGGVEAAGYLGPHGAIFMPEGDVPASASVRSFAAVTRRTQPGVGMAPATVVTVKKTTRTTSSGK